MSRRRRGLAILALVAIVTVGCGASATSNTADRRSSTRVSIRGEAGDGVGLQRFVTTYSEAPLYRLLDTNLPGSIEDIFTLVPSCEGYVRGKVVGIERLKGRVSLSTGAEGEPPDFWLDTLAVGLRVVVDSSSLRSSPSYAPGSEVLVRLPVWQGKPSSDRDAAEADFMRPLLSAPPVGAALQAFVVKVDSGKIVEPCTGGFGVVGALPDGTGVTSFGRFATNGAVFGISTLDELEIRTESFLKPT